MNLARRFEEIAMMTTGEADILLGQWADWASDNTRTGIAIGSWQRDYRPTYDPESTSDARRYGSVDENVMVRVDGALARLGHTDAHNAHVLRARYRMGYQFVGHRLDHALRQFAAAFELTPE